MRIMKPKQLPRPVFTFTAHETKELSEMIPQIRNLIYHLQNHKIDSTTLNFKYPF